MFVLGSVELDCVFGVEEDMFRAEMHMSCGGSREEISKSNTLRYSVLDLKISIQTGVDGHLTSPKGMITLMV